MLLMRILPTSVIGPQIMFIALGRRQHYHRQVHLKKAKLIELSAWLARHHKEFVL